MNREDFPILERKVNGLPLVYFDNAATSQKPKVVIDSLTKYYEESNANTNRGLHNLGEESTNLLERARQNVAEFVGAKCAQEMIFTSGATESLNIIAQLLSQKMSQNDEIIIDITAHNSNFLPWQQLASKHGFVLRFVKINKNGEIDLTDLESKINDKTRVISISHISNVLGSKNDLAKISKLVKANNLYFAVDGAQSFGHTKIDLTNTEVDFYAFSSHKMGGIMGSGGFYFKRELMDEFEPVKFGGGMVDYIGGDFDENDFVTEESIRQTKWAKIPERFEAGTQNIAGTVALSSAIKYINQIGIDKTADYVKMLTSYAIDKMGKQREINIYGASNGIITFNVAKIHSHDASTALNEYGISVRSGHFCAQPLMRSLGIGSAVRVSLAYYNTKKEIDCFMKAIAEIQEYFRAK